MTNQLTNDIGAFGKLHQIGPEFEPRTIDIELGEEDEPSTVIDGAVGQVENEGDRVKLIGDDDDRWRQWLGSDEEATTEPYFFSNEVIHTTVATTDVNQTRQNRTASLTSPSSTNYSDRKSKPINQFKGSI